MDIKDASLYKPTQKRQYTIRCNVPPIGTKVHSILGEGDYETDENKCVVMTGTVGEKWAVTAEKLTTTYTHPDGTPITEDDIQFLRESGDEMLVRTLPGIPSFAMHVPVQMKPVVQASWGVMLSANSEGIDHGDGDYIVCSSKDGAPDLEDMWVVNGRVFETTYEPIR